MAYEALIENRSDLPRNYNAGTAQEHWYWGKSDCVLRLREPLADPNSPDGDWFDWLNMSEDVVRSLHKATGEYLAKKAQERRNNG